MSAYQKQVYVTPSRTRTRSQSFPDYSENNERFKKPQGITVRAKLQSREAPASSSTQTMLKEFKAFPKNTSTSILGKIQESFKLMNESRYAETEKEKKMWYHLHISTTGEKKLANRFTLSFVNSKLEAKYLEERFNRLLWQVRVMSAICILIVMAYGLADYLYSRNEYQELFVVRFAAAVPAMALVLLLMFTKTFKKAPQVLVVMFCFFMGIQFSVSGVFSSSFQLLYYQSMLWPIAFSFIFMGTQTVYALGLAILLIGTMFLGFSTTAVRILTTHQMIYQVVYFAAYAYIFEMQIRREFLLRRVVDRERTLLKREKETSEEVLLNILPKPIAERIKQKESVADRFSKCTVLFAKIIDIGRIEARNVNDLAVPREPASILVTTKPDPIDVFNILNEIFSLFDSRIEMFGLEKIKTIGETYMVVGGVPIPSENHAQSVAEFALDMKEVIKHYNRKHKTAISIRIGFHTGPVVAGVIGNLKMIYDLWGDTCNVASRMESNSLPDRIQVSQASYDLLHEKYIFENRGPFQIKGKGKMNTYFLEGKDISKARRDFKNNVIKKPLQASLIIEREYVPVERHGEVDIIKTLISGVKFVNKFTLSFIDPSHEPKFMRASARNSRSTVQLGLLLVILFHVISWSVEAGELSGGIFIRYVTFKVVAVAIYLTLLLVITKFPTLYEHHIQLFAFVSANAFFAYTILAGAFVDNTIYWGISSALFFLFLFTKLRFVIATPLGWLYFILFKVITNIDGLEHFDTDSNVVATCLFFALTAVLMFTHYYNEYLERRDFFMGLELERQREKIEEEKEKSDQLLLNILPKPVIINLKHKKAEPEQFRDVTVLCADIVGFTDFCSNKTPAEVVHVLSQLFLKFDEIVNRYNVEKIKTVGDAYIVAGGVPLPTKDHANQVTCFALDMLEAVQNFNRATSRDLKLRIGIHTGPCVAGLMGTRRFNYDLLGEAISIASHAETNGVPGRIHITEECKLRLNPRRFVIEERKENMETKRKGKFRTYFVLYKIESDLHDYLDSVPSFASIPSQVYN